MLSYGQESSSNVCMFVCSQIKMEELDAMVCFCSFWWPYETLHCLQLERHPLAESVFIITGM